MNEQVELVDVYAIRRRNLEILIAGAGGVKQLGERMLEWQQRKSPGEEPKDYPNALSQYKTGKNMGARFARNLEEAVSRPKNWMDMLQPDPAGLLGMEAQQIVDSLEPEDQEAAMRVLRHMQKKNGRSNPFRDVPKPEWPKGDTK